jgi:hypothetical protein
VGREVRSWETGEGGHVQRKLQQWEARLESMLEKDSGDLANFTSKWTSGKKVSW